MFVLCLIGLFMFSVFPFLARAVEEMVSLQTVLKRFIALFRRLSKDKLTGNPI